MTIALATDAPNFDLPGVDEQQHTLDRYADKPALAVVWSCNHCPYVQAWEGRMVALQREFGDRGFQLVAISSNDADNYPDDAFDKLAARWRERGYGFPYLHDEGQDVAHAFGAVCTPDIFVYDRDRRLAYRGRIDDSWKDESRVTRRELAEAIEALVAGQRPSREQRPSMGCSIKWRQAA